MKQRSSIAVVFLVGCATGGVTSQLASSQLVVPPARAGTDPARWEYLCAERQKLSTADMNRSGAQGWELVSVVPTHQDHEFDQDLAADRFVSCFKRLLP